MRTPGLWGCCDYIIPLRERFDQSSSSEQFVATLPDHVSLFMKFVTKCLLNSSTLDGLGQVTQHFQRLDGHVQGLVPPVGLVLVRMAAFNHQSEDTLELKDVPFAKRQVLIESKLWCAFMHKRFMTRLVKVRDSVAVDHAGRLRIVRELAGQAETAGADLSAEKHELEVARTLLGDLSFECKVLYLLGNVEHFKILTRWLLVSPSVRFHPLACTSASFVGMEAASSRSLQNL